MSGHSKWHSIKHKKGLADAKRGQIFTKHAKNITVGAKTGGGDPDKNPTLALAIERAKKDNMPNVNIERAIAAGTGEGKDTEIFDIIYEGYGPCGIALYIHALTDNKNRTVANIRAAMNKLGGALGEMGSVAYMFRRQGIILLKKASLTDEEELELIELGCESIEPYDDEVELTTKDTELHQVLSGLKAKNYPIEKAFLTYSAETKIPITNQEDAEKIMRLMEALEDDDDVDEVWTNADISDEFMNE